MNEARQEFWELRNISKIFPGVKALDNVDLSLYPGEVHGLLGENGSGKSTLIKCLSGVHLPSSGAIRCKGQEVVIPDPETAQSYGIATIFQELSLVPTLTVAENIFLGRLPRIGKVVDWKGMEEKSVELLERLKISIDPGALVEDLSVAQQQMVEIAKALSMDSELLIMDEPTAALGMEDIENLHELIRNLTKSGCAVLYISHRMDEVKKIVDRATVLKDGALAGVIDAGDIDVGRIVRMMIGGEVGEHYPKQRNVQEDTIVCLEGLKTETGLHGVDFTIRKGEVLGLAGVIGSGRTEIAKALFGIDRSLAGQFNGESLPKSSEEAVRRGIALISENRKADGIFINFTGSKNITVSAIRKLKRKGVLSLKDEDSITEHYIRKLNMPPTTRYLSIESLSGGNQQKAIISRWLYCDADLFILDEPTQGIDIGAKVEVYNIINELTNQGKAVLLISSDFPELLAMSDRIALVHHGRISDIREAGDLDVHSLIEAVVSKESLNSETEVK